MQLKKPKKTKQISLFFFSLFTAYNAEAPAWQIAAL